MNVTHHGHHNRATGNVWITDAQTGEVVARLRPAATPVDAYDAIGEATGYVRLGNWTNYGSDTGFPYREVGLTTWAELAEAEEASA